MAKYTIQPYIANSLKFKNGITFLLPLAFVFSPSVIAQDNGNAESREAPVLTSLGPLDSKSLPQLSQGDLLTPLQTAPPLTDMFIYAIGSSDCGWEYPPSGATSTSCNHGGAVMQAAVFELGYGSSRIAWMGGGTLPSSAYLGSSPVCESFGELTFDCTAGLTIVGWVVDYDLSGWQGGFFRYQNTSTNSPFNTMSVQINIL